MFSRAYEDRDEYVGAVHRVQIGYLKRPSSIQGIAPDCCDCRPELSRFARLNLDLLSQLAEIGDEPVVPPKPPVTSYYSSYSSYAPPVVLSKRQELAAFVGSQRLKNSVENSVGV